MMFNASFMVRDSATRNSFASLLMSQWALAASAEMAAVAASTSVAKRVGTRPPATSPSNSVADVGHVFRWMLGTLSL